MWKKKLYVNSIDVFDAVLPEVPSILVCKNGEIEKIFCLQIFNIKWDNALEESDEEFSQNFYIIILPTQSANNYVTDEDSGEEDEVN